MRVDAGFARAGGCRAERTEKAERVGETEPQGSVTLTPSVASGEGAETTLHLHFDEVPPLRVHPFDQKELPPPAQTLQPLLAAYRRQYI